MTWLFIWGLLVWLVIRARPVSDLRRRTERLEHKLVELLRAPPDPEHHQAARDGAATAAGLA